MEKLIMLSILPNIDKQQKGGALNVVEVLLKLILMTV